MTTSSKSWRALRPRKNFNCPDSNDETESEYVARLKPKYDIPLEVAEQWLYIHYENSHTIQNYSWMDFNKLRFVRAELDEKTIFQLNVIDEYQDLVSERSENRDYDDFVCIPKDVDFWRVKSTWRVPPIVLDVESLPSLPPVTADIRGPYQLVEGHCRLGNFLALKAAEKLMDRKHTVYLLTSKQLAR